MNSTADPDSAFPKNRLDRAIRAFDEENSRDPNREIVSGIARPRELVYAERLSSWVNRLRPDASEALRLAARCQHICRWTIPRDQYPMNRPGYLRWRSALKEFHARKAGEILTKLSFPPELIQRVQALNLKKGFPEDPEVRVLEDALCLVFLEFQFADLAAKTPEERMTGVLKKTWAKMTPEARSIALSLPYAPNEKRLLDQALAPG